MLYFSVYRTHYVNRLTHVGDYVSHHDIAGVGHLDVPLGTNANFDGGLLIFFMPGILSELSIWDAIQPIGSSWYAIKPQVK